MGANSESLTKIEASLLEGASIRRVIELQVADAGADLVVGAKVDLDSDLTMKEVSTILLQAKRRVQKAIPEARIVYLEPDVWIDPEVEQPTTSAIVMLGLD
jgi:divalent metal cation (Fe/Co/Zn/Cd) transporter